LNSQLSFIFKNYRPKCDTCNEICDIEWRTQRLKELPTEMPYNGNTILKSTIKPLLICNKCYDNGFFPKDLTKNNFDFSNFYNVVSQISNEGN